MFDDMAPLTEVKTKKERKTKPVYKLGSADPICYAKEKSREENKVTQGFMGGCDTKIYVDDEPLHVAQAISVQQDRAMNIYEGTLIVIGSPGMEEVKDFLAKKECHMMVKAADEFGNVEISFDHKIRIDGHSWGVSVDDLITETVINFTVLD
jgi:hypothetical protein